MDLLCQVVLMYNNPLESVHKSSLFESIAPGMGLLKSKVTVGKYVRPWQFWNFCLFWHWTWICSSVSRDELYNQGTISGIATRCSS
jgi:hypothetical protein